MSFKHQSGKVKTSINLILTRCNLVLPIFSFVLICSLPGSVELPGAIPLNKLLNNVGIKVQQLNIKNKSLTDINYEK